jgi:peptide/nickel transport system permease protein
MTTPISGGSLREAELPGVTGVTWKAQAAPSESPFVQGLRRLRRSHTALVGAGIVALLIVVAIFADVLAPMSPIASDQMHTFAGPRGGPPRGTDQLGPDKRHPRIPRPRQ